MSIRIGNTYKLETLTTIRHVISNAESNESAKEMLFFFSKLTPLPLNYNLRMKLTTTNRFGNLSNLSCKNNQQKAATLSYEDKEKGYRKAFTVDSVSAKVGSGYGKKNSSSSSPSFWLGPKLSSLPSFSFSFSLSMLSQNLLFFLLFQISPCHP